MYGRRAARWQSSSGGQHRSCLKFAEKIELTAELQSRVVLLCGRLVTFRPPLYVIPDEAFGWG